MSAATLEAFAPRPSAPTRPHLHLVRTEDDAHIERLVIALARARGVPESVVRLVDLGPLPASRAPVHHLVSALARAQGASEVVVRLTYGIT